jgi:hypothetical protein
MPYLTDAEPPPPSFCDGSLIDLEWVGAWDDESRPRQMTCAVCGAKLWVDAEEYEAGPKTGLFFAWSPLHYPGENSWLLDWGK